MVGPDESHRHAIRLDHGVDSGFHWVGVASGVLVGGRGLCGRRLRDTTEVFGGSGCRSLAGLGGQALVCGQLALGNHAVDRGHPVLFGDTAKLSFKRTAFDV